MPTLNGRNFTGVVGLNIREANGCIRFETPLITPTTTSGECLLYRSGTNLVWDNGSTIITLANAAGVATTWDQLYSNDKTLAINSTSLTFALTHATNDGLTITGSAGSSGDCIQITNSGSGSDIEGTSATWSISKAGAAVLTAITGCDSLTAAANLVLEATGAGTISIGATSTGAIDIGTGGGAVTIATATTASLGITITAGGLVSSDGLVDIIDNSNAASTLRVTNDTQSTYGNASDAGMVVFRSESLTTGALLHLSLDETNHAGGFFLRCWSQDAGAIALTVGEYGATVITGVASGTDALTLTNGDITVTSGDITASEGSLVLVNTANESALTVTADSVTDGIVVDINADGVTTGTLLHLDSTAATFNGLYIQCYDGAAAEFSVGLDGATIITTSSAGTIGLTVTHGGTTGDAMQITCSALTTGDALQIASTAETLAAGELLKITNTESGDLSATPKTGNVASITSSVTATTADTTLEYDTLLISRSDIVNQGTKTLTSSGSVLKLLHTVTQTAGTSTDSAVVLEVQATESAGGLHTGAVAFINNDATTAISLLIDAESTTANVLDISAVVLTEGKAIDLSDLDAITTGKAIHVDATGNTQTTGILVHIDSGSGVIATTGRLFLSDHTGTAGTTAVLNEFKSASTADEQILRVTATAALAGGVVLDISAAALTTGKCIDISALDAITTGKAIHVDATGVTQTDGILVHIDSGSTALTSTGRLLLVDHTGNASVSGVITELKTVATDETVLLSLSAAAMATGKVISCSDNTALTTGAILDLRVNSADTSASSIAYIEQTHASAASRVPLKTKQVAATSTNYYKAQQIVTAVGTWTLFVGNGTNSPNGSLSGTAGDLCVNCDSGNSYRCTGTTNWTAM